MASVNGIEKAEAWELVLHCWMTFFKDLCEVRVSCSGLSIGQTEIGSPERKEVVARYIWTMGKAISVQNKYIEAQFKNHPSVARVINYHIFHNKVPTSAFDKAIDDIKTSLKDFGSWKGAINRQISKLENKSK